MFATSDTLTLATPTPALASQALVDAIDATYGPRLRVVAGSELDALGA